MKQTIGILLVFASMAFFIIALTTNLKIANGLPLPNILLAVTWFATLSIGMFLALSKQKKKRIRQCRLCEKRKEAMAITYGEEEGLCRECLDEVLPYALRGKQ